MKKLLIVLLLIFGMHSSFADVPLTADFDTATKNLKIEFESFIAGVADNFDMRGKLVKDFVPVEAKIGRSFLSALSETMTAVYKLFIPFLNAFVLALLGFWILAETWQMISSKENDVWDLAQRIVKKCVLVVIWGWVMNHDPEQLFLWIVSPMITVGSAVADAILGGAAKVIGAELPDTCSAIHTWMAGDNSLFISSEYAAELLCLPTRTAGFFATAVRTGLDWMKYGLGHSAGTFIMGLIVVIMFVINSFRFALAALSVVVDLFFVLLFLPFTAVKECFAAGDTKYKGMFASILSEFTGFIKSATLGEQFMRFIRAILYFIILSMVAAICIALLVGTDMATSGDFVSILIAGLVTNYLLGKADEIASKLGGGIDESFGNQVKSVAQNIGKGIVDWGGKALDVAKNGKPTKK